MKTHQAEEVVCDLLAGATRNQINPRVQATVGAME